ncbi:DUF3558 domain-containing protein [Saccharopolyspora pogona]|uniref:DUF3558 domain-containing protein n=1 Tax=Saccharopolyspora pogona TaxID=333966 RepID=UPI0016899FE6|nr:DUF3558 domain-containing protein [Saccharopolyspora pogona]
MIRILQIASAEEDLRKVFVAGSIIFGLVLTGCGGNPENTTPGGDATSEKPTATEESPTPPRSGPAKATDVAEKCSIVPESVSQGEGADQAPRELESNGRMGCKYQKGKAGTPGWSVFVAVSGQTSYDAEVGKRVQPTKTADLGGYPGVEYQDGTGCVLYADISDNGFLIANAGKTGTADPGVDLCQQAEKFAQAAIQNLPDA